MLKKSQNILKVRVSHSQCNIVGCAIVTGLGLDQDAWRICAGRRVRIVTFDWDERCDAATQPTAHGGHSSEERAMRACVWGCRTAVPISGGGRLPRPRLVQRAARSGGVASSASAATVSSSATTEVCFSPSRRRVTVRSSTSRAPTARITGTLPTECSRTL